MTIADEVNQNLSWSQVQEKVTYDKESVLKSFGHISAAKRFRSGS